MGVGKTVVGRMLAERLGLEFIDLDEEIVKRTGKPISDIFMKEGENWFRKLEKSITHEVSSLDGRVISCGGGTVLDPDNLKDLRRGGVMILLTTDPETILERVGKDSSRPLLGDLDGMDSIRSLLGERWKRYLEAADIIVDTTNGTPDDTVSGILKALEGV